MVRWSEMTAKILLQNALLAGADLSAATLQFSMVKLSAGAVVPVAATTDVPYGVLLNSPKSGEVAEVALLGLTKIRVGATDIAAAAAIGYDAAGRAVTVASGSRIVGAIESISNADNDGALATASINFLSLSRALVAGG